MRVKPFPIAWLVYALLAGMCLAMFTGCKTTPFDLDWNSRVGSYTYDQAVMDLGVPDKTTRLSTGQLVAEWLRPANSGLTFGIGNSFTSGGAGLGVGQTVGTTRRDRFLQLTFGLDHKLVNFAKNY